MAWAAYLPKLIYCAAIFLALVISFLRLRIGRALGSVLLVISTSTLIGIFLIGEVRQVAFGAFILLPFVGGVLVAPHVDEVLSSKLVFYSGVMWLCAAAGVAYNFFYDVPWQGFSYQLGDAELVASREWTSFGLQRIAGFSRASFNAAGQLVLLSIPLLVFGRRVSVKILVWLATSILAAITTTKNELGAVLLVGLTLPMVSTRLLSMVTRRALIRFIPWFIATSAVALPLTALAYGPAKQIDRHDLLYSFEDRLANTWPSAFALVEQHGSWFLGRGVGGVGQGQAFFEPTLYNPADNLFVYLYVSFGVFSLLFMYVLASGLGRLRAECAPRERLWWLAGNAIMMSGWAMNVIEEPIQAMVLGLTFTHVLQTFIARRLQRGHLRRMGK